MIHVQSCFTNPTYGIFAVPVAVAVFVALTPYCFRQEIPKGSSLPNLFFHNPNHSPNIIYSYIIFIFSEKEPRIGGLEKGQLSNNNGNKNVKIKKWLSKQNNNSARASHFLVRFFAVTARLRNETSYCHSDDQLQIFLSLYKLDGAVTIKLQKR